MRAKLLTLFLIFTVGLALQLPAAKTVVDVYYFHGNQRCMSCNKIEAYTKEAVEKNFAADIKKGRVVMHVVNLDDAANKHYIQDFQIGAKSVLVTRSVDGKAESMRKLDQVWVLLRDKKKFQTYVQKNVDAAKKGA